MIVIGGMSQQKQERLINRKPDIIVATPGRFWKLVSESIDGDYLNDFSGVESVVVDETDRMIEKGHFEEMEHLLDHIST